MKAKQNGQVMLEYLIICVGLIVLSYGVLNSGGGVLGELLNVLRGFYDKYCVFVAQLMV